MEALEIPEVSDAERERGVKEGEKRSAVTAHRQGEHSVLSRHFVSPTLFLSSSASHVTDLKNIYTRLEHPLHCRLETRLVLPRLRRREGVESLLEPR